MNILNQIFNVVIIVGGIGVAVSAFIGSIYLGINVLMKLFLKKDARVFLLKQFLLLAAIMFLSFFFIGWAGTYIISIITKS